MITIIIINDNKNKNTTKKNTITIMIISWIQYSLISAKHRIYGDRGGLQLFTESPPARGVFGRSYGRSMPCLAGNRSSCSFTGEYLQSG